ncbi:hypothetical protein SETIT_2G082000v2 [Setaria italica]|uniref:Uncharacterized protein n=2 Tax=Setaria TaxID=4554 RepID=A0A368PWA9_SETIT|nr:hypothetical protein SETIT_2G082000v2 [Setaria italica]
MPRPRAPVTAPARTGRASARPYPPKLPPQAFLPPSVLSCNSKQAALALQIATTGSFVLPALPRIQQTGHQLLQSVSPSSLISTSHTSSTSSTNPWRPSHLRSSASPLLGQSKQTSAPLTSSITFSDFLHQATAAASLFNAGQASSWSSSLFCPANKPAAAAHAHPSAARPVSPAWPLPEEAG